MKKELSPKTLAMIGGVVVVIILIAVYVLFFRGPSGNTAKELGIGPPAKPGGGVVDIPSGGDPSGRR